MKVYHQAKLLRKFIIVVSFLVLFLADFTIVQAGFERREVGARQRAIGGAFVGLTDDVWAIYYNPAGLSNLNQSQVSVFYSPQSFGLSELSNGAIVGMVPTELGNFGLGVQHFGFELYQELSFTLGYSRIVSDVNVGINLAYNNVSIKNYGSSGAIGFDVGFLIPLSQQVKIGVSATNLNGPTVGSTNEKLGRTFSSGISYVPTQELILAFDYVKEIDQQASPRFGFEYWVIKSVALRAGVSDEPTSYSAGLGIRYSIFQVDYAFYSHQEFGLTHQASILFTFGNDE